MYIVSFSAWIRWIAVVFALVGSIAGGVFAQGSAIGKYKAGQRVECEFPDYGGTYRLGTILTVVGEGSTLTCCRYRVRFDDEEPLWREEGRLCSERGIRIPGTDKTTPAAQPPPNGTTNTSATSGNGKTSCPFTKNYPFPSGKAAPSPALFKAVIFDWENSLNKRFSDFGITFQTFSLGRAFKNRVYPGINVRRDVDSARPGTTIYPIRTKLVVCQKDLSITLRRVWDIKYDCYKDIDGSWTCKNNAPRILESSSFPHVEP